MQNRIHYVIVLNRILHAGENEQLCDQAISNPCDHRQGPNSRSLMIRDLDLYQHKHWQ